MLIGLRNFFHFQIMAQDGEIGRVAGFHFDDQQWVVRYLVVETGGWLGRRVLISPLSVLRADRDLKTLYISLNRKQVRNSPKVDDGEIPISRQKELEYHDYYRWPYYWTGAGVFGAAMPFPAMIPDLALPEGDEPDIDEQSRVHRETFNPHLASTNDVSGYKIHALDGNFGSLADLVVSDRDWKVGYLVVDTRRWLPGKNVLLPPDHVKSVDWDKREIQADLTHAEILNSPVISPDEEILPTTETRIQSYYTNLKSGTNRQRAG